MAKELSAAAITSLPSCCGGIAILRTHQLVHLFCGECVRYLTTYILWADAMNGRNSGIVLT